MSFSMFRGTSTITCNSTVSNAAITTSTVSSSAINSSTIDMNAGVITSHGNPVNQTDVVNKQYVDNLTFPLIQYQVALFDTTPSIINANVSGTFLITVKNRVTNGPSATFHISKNESTNEAAITRPTHCPGKTSGETLLITWPIGSPILLHKTDMSYNGLYNIISIANL